MNELEREYARQRRRVLETTEALAIAYAFVGKREWYEHGAPALERKLALQTGVLARLHNEIEGRKRRGIVRRLWERLTAKPYKHWARQSEIRSVRSIREFSYK